MHGSRFQNLWPWRQILEPRAHAYPSVLCLGKTEYGEKGQRKNPYLNQERGPTFRVIGEAQILTTKESVFESGAWTNISCNRRSTNFEFHLITIGRDLVQLPVFVTAALKRKYKKLAFILSRVCPSLPPVYNGIRLCMPPLLHHPPFILRKQVAFVLIQDSKGRIVHKFQKWRATVIKWVCMMTSAATSQKLSQ